MLVLAQETSAGSGIAGLLLPLLLFGGIFYFLIIRPQRNRVRKQQELAQAMEIGDHVRTYGGVFGVVVAIDDEAVVLGLEEGRMRVAKQAIAARLNTETEG